MKVLLNDALTKTVVEGGRELDRGLEKVHKLTQNVLGEHLNLYSAIVRGVD